MESSWLRDISYGGIGACWKSLKFVHVGIENEFTLKNSFEWSVRTGFQVSLPLSLRRQQFLLQINLLFLQNRPNLLHFVLVSLGWVFYTPSSLVSSAATSSVSSNWGFVSSAASPGKTSCYAIEKLGQLPTQRTKRFSYLRYYGLVQFMLIVSRLVSSNVKCFQNTINFYKCLNKKIMFNRTTKSKIYVHYLACCWSQLEQTARTIASVAWISDISKTCAFRWTKR